MSRFQPQISYQNTQGKFIVLPFSTYALLKKHLPEHLENNMDDLVSVVRSRRGEWGEWFEHWAYVDGKLRIVQEGWM